MDDAQLPPPRIHPGDYVDAQAARQRLAKSSFWQFASRKNASAPDLRRKKWRMRRNRNAGDAEDNSISPVQSIVVHDDGSDIPPEIDLRDDIVHEDENRDEYRWAILYENQRGYASVLYMYSCPIH